MGSFFLRGPENKNWGRKNTSQGRKRRIPALVDGNPAQTKKFRPKEAGFVKKL
jgi:hypothetical protein